MKWSARDKIRIGFWILPLVPVLLAIVAYSTASDAIDVSREVVRDSELIRVLGEVLSEIKDVEVVQREYVLTGDKVHLKDVEPKRRAVMNAWQAIKANYTFTPSQRNYIQVLDPLIAQKFDELRHTVQLFEDGLEERAKALVTGDDKSLADINLVFRRVTEEEVRRLKARQNDVRLLFVRAIIVFGIFLAINIVLVWLLFRYMKRELAEREREEERIRLEKIELEQRVAQRTEALRRSNEELQQFAYIASHDLQEPLRMVRSYVELLKKRYGDKLDPDADEFIGFAVDGTRRMSALIQALLEYSKAGEVSGDQLPEQEVEHSLRTAIENLKVTIDESKGQVTYGEMPNASFDPVRLSQIFQNLIGNALKYRNDRPPRIHVSAKVEENQITFAIEDNGIGIAPEHHERIFGVFKRLHGREYEGTGIGLATVKKIVERHGGRIWLESQPGKGSTFFFTIPNHAGTPRLGASAKA